MNIRQILILFCAMVAGDAALADQPVLLREPWQQPYRDGDATGAHVIGYWPFDSTQPTADKSGHGHDGVLEGATVASDGKFDACLHSARGWPVSDTRHRLRVPNDTRLSPKGAFALEMWINADPTIADYSESFLLDKKYVADTDYQLILGRAEKDGTRALRANLGFGNRSVTWYSTPLHLAPGTWYHIAFTYNGKGRGRFFVDGRLCGERQEDGVAGVQPGKHPLSIGDRIGSYYHGFPGRIDEVRITEGLREFGAWRVEQLTDRRCFLRMESNAILRFRVTNLQRVPIDRLAVRWQLDGTTTGAKTPGPLQPGASCEIRYELDTRLRPDSYRLAVEVASGNEGSIPARRAFALTIVPRPLPDRFPVVMWGAGPAEIDRLRRIGFTHALGIGADYGRIWKAGEPTQPDDAEKVATLRRTLDQALPQGVRFAASLSPGSYLRREQRLLRVDRAGKPRTSRPDICGLFPEVPTFCFNVGVSVARAYGDLPAFNAALLHTEVRDAAQPCFHPHDFAAYRKATGTAIPAAITNRWGVNYEKLANFPNDRVIPNDDPIYRYYQWYWKHGDGWNHLNSELRRGLDQMHRTDFWTWHDPAVRVASVYGSGGNVDVISQWTYSYPDPIRIGVATDELLAMARGAARPQQVMKMTQIIWYRSQTAPVPKTGDASSGFQARWEREQPDAPFITIAPMHLREAFWTKIARPIRGIMYHGWQSLVPVEGQYGYRYTNPATQSELQRLIHTIVQPLGPAMLHIPGIQSDCAYYESFAAQVFAQRGTYGWSGKWLGDAYQVMMWAGLQPEIVFDETIVQHGLDAYKLLVMMDCDVVTQAVADKIRRFQQRGGIVIGDEHTAPGIKPDIVLSGYQRTGKALADKTRLMRIAAHVRESLHGRYDRYLDSSNPEVIPYRRRHADTDYIFLINDARQYGTYVGHHGLVMEDGQPSRTTVTLMRGKSFVYDLVRHQPLATREPGTQTTFPVQLDPCAGRLLMITSRPIKSVTLRIPTDARKGARVNAAIRVVDPDGKPLHAVVPVRVTIEKSDTRRAEFSGYWAAVDGQVAIPLDIASNDPAGIWTVHVTELASGQAATKYLHVAEDVDSSRPAPIDKKLADPVQPHG